MLIKIGETNLNLKLYVFFERRKSLFLYIFLKIFPKSKFILLSSHFDSHDLIFPKRYVTLQSKVWFGVNSQLDYGNRCTHEHPYWIIRFQIYNQENIKLFKFSSTEFVLTMFTHLLLVRFKVWNQPPKTQFF